MGLSELACCPWFPRIMSRHRRDANATPYFVVANARVDNLGTLLTILDHVRTDRIRLHLRSQTELPTLVFDAPVRCHPRLSVMAAAAALSKRLAVSQAGNMYLIVWFLPCLDTLLMKIKGMFCSKEYTPR